jgi:DNA polymerase III delta subunit
MNFAIAKTPHSFTLLTGNDTISREKARDDIIAAVQERAGQAEIERFDPEAHSSVSFTERMITPSLFQTVRVFLVLDAHTLSREDLENFSSVFPYDIPDVFVIIESEKSKAGKNRERAVPKEFGKFIESFMHKTEEQPSKFASADFTMPPDYKMTDWLESQTPLLVGRTISKPDAGYLIDLVGNDSAVLYSELQKIDIHLPPKKPIDRAAIESVSGATRLMTQFECAQALGRKDFARVLEIIDSLYLGSVYLPLYINAIFKHFWALFRINNYALANPQELSEFQRAIKRYDKAVQNNLGLKIGVAAGLLSNTQAGGVYPIIIKSGVVQQALSFREQDYKKIFKWLGEYDIGIKTGRIDDSKIGFQLLCYKIFRAGALE